MNVNDAIQDREMGRIAPVKHSTGGEVGHTKEGMKTMKKSPIISKGEDYNRMNQCMNCH